MSLGWQSTQAWFELEGPKKVLKGSSQLVSKKIVRGLLRATSYLPPMWGKHQLTKRFGKPRQISLASNSRALASLVTIASVIFCLKIYMSSQIIQMYITTAFDPMLKLNLILLDVALWSPRNCLTFFYTITDFRVSILEESSKISDLSSGRCNVEPQRRKLTVSRRTFSVKSRFKTSYGSTPTLKLTSRHRKLPK